MSGALSEAVLQNISAVSTDGHGNGIGGETSGADGDVSKPELATSGLRQHPKREERGKSGGRLREPDLHDPKAGTEREPAEHRRRVVAASERSDLQQEDASNSAQGKHRPDQPGGEVRDQNILNISTYLKTKDVLKINI